MISQQAAERGYHIFYQLLSGRKPELIGETDKAAMSPVNMELKRTEAELKDPHQLCESVFPVFPFLCNTKNIFSHLHLAKEEN